MTAPHFSAVLSPSSGHPDIRIAPRTSLVVLGAGSKTIMAVALRRPTDLKHDAGSVDLLPPSCAWEPLLAQLKAYLACSGFDVAAPLCVDWCVRAGGTAARNSPMPVCCSRRLSGPRCTSYRSISRPQWRVLGAALRRVPAPEESSCDGPAFLACKCVLTGSTVSSIHSEMLSDLRCSGCKERFSILEKVVYGLLRTVQKLYWKCPTLFTYFHQGGSIAPLLSCRYNLCALVLCIPSFRGAQLLSCQISIEHPL